MMSIDEIIKKHGSDLSEEDKYLVRAFALGLIMFRHEKELIKLRNILNSIIP